MARDFKVDLSHMQQTIDKMTQFTAQAESWCQEVDADVQSLHGTWSGEAASAQKAAHDQWVAGLNAMKADLEKLKKIAQDGHANYTDAGNKNKEMWSF
ncbi:WXG100 family type VII secretion target [Segniliparus rugosus]|uniref:ESAT-6-like protein n=1 Tax=Segniliparus rugosus (strain ATCC BAA-974 / DSM 45345 / CCUG 50838 / CIP 108380 / JCM 13579 / CDC 945) TaxID=679197 RepID=E5XKZ6_SEGRC|nr:WXG100 family type VII secretion target [Segniliparus rugosus]EFV14978.1 WXG100 family type VII secretion target [Segniliparus rugosus ATCC BAA-974]